MFVNLIAFNLVWLGLVYWGDVFIPAAAIFLFWHLYAHKSKESGELTLILIVASIGVIVDSILQFIGVFIFSETLHLPLWLIFLWLCFATTISHSLNFISHSMLHQCLVGAFLAPMSYIAGQQFNVVNFGVSTLETYMILGVIWAGLMVSFFSIRDIVVKPEVIYD